MRSSAELNHFLSPDALPVLVSYVDTGLVYKYCNQRYVDWFGFNPADRDLTVRELLGAAGFERVRHHFDQALSGLPTSYEATMVIDQRPRHLKVYLAPDRESGGRVNGLFATIIDVTGGQEAERTLRATARRLALHVRHTPLAVIEWSPDLRVVEWNRAAEVVFGYSREEARGQRAVDLIVSEAGRQEMELAFDALLSQQGGTYGEYQNRTRDDRVILCEWHNTPLLDEQGQVVGVASMIQDITERRHTERALEQSHAALQVVLDAIPVRVFWKNTNLVYEGCNHLFARDAGLNRQEEIIGRQDFELGWKDRAEEYRRDDRQVIESGIPKLNYEEGLTTPNGEQRWLRTSKVPLRGADGSVVGVMGCYEDITERHEAERLIQESEERFRMLAEHIDQAFWFVEVGDPLRVLYLSPAFERTWGVTAQEIYDRPDTWMAHVHPDDREALTWAFGTLVSGARDRYELDYRVVRADGTTRWVRDRATALPPDANGVLRVSGIIDDITERRDQEEQLGNFFNLSYDLLCVAAADGTFRRINPAFTDLLGYTPEELIGRQFLDFVHPDDRKISRRHIQALQKGQPVVAVEKRVRTRNGAWRHLVWNAVSTPDGLVYATARDVTGQREAEGQLKSSEERYRHLIESSATAMLEQDMSGVHTRLEALRKKQRVTDLGRWLDDNPGQVREIASDMRVVNANAAAVRLFEADSREQLVTAFDRCFLAGTWDGYRSSLIAMFDGAARFDREIPFRTLSGREISVLVSFGIPTAGKGFGQLAVTLTDLTGLREAEAFARSRDQLMRSVVGVAEMVLFALDADGCFTLSEGSGLKRMGLEPGEVVGRTVFDLYRDYPDIIEEIRKGLSGQPCHYTAVMDGVAFETQLTPRFDPVGRCTGLVGVAVDVSRTHSAEEEARKALEEVERLKERLQAENIYLQEELRTEQRFEEIVGQSASLAEILGKVEQVAPTGAAVLIHGESGTGKELIARAVHDLSRRSGRPMVKINCGAIPENLVESELFGHEAGSFTGAERQRVGRFELADGGTLFLDEIGELPLDAQVKLLRVLQEGEFERVGGNRTVRCDVRIIAATNRDLQQMVDAGRFRTDLFYRLNVFPLKIPPLRKRTEDIPALVQHFLGGFAERYGKPVDGISTGSMQRLMTYPWPGNIRELQNVIERAVIVARRRVIHIDPAALGVGGGAEASGNRTLEAVERAHIVEILEETGGKIAGSRGAAAVLGMHPNTLRSRMAKLGIVKPGGGKG
ncbi:MAG: PAS domain S-box protein [Nitrospirota bacterium]|nr:PAS domain S-box protein [Nitrospirota bacterium]